MPDKPDTPVERNRRSSRKAKTKVYVVIVSENASAFTDTRLRRTIKRILDDAGVDSEIATE